MQFNFRNVRDKYHFSDFNRITEVRGTEYMTASVNAEVKGSAPDTSYLLFVSAWEEVNRETGTLVVAGHYDSNNNHKYDIGDKPEIGIYDLKTLKLIRKI